MGRSLEPAATRVSAGRPFGQHLVPLPHVIRCPLDRVFTKVDPEGRHSELSSRRRRPGDDPGDQLGAWEDADDGVAVAGPIDRATPHGVHKLPATPEPGALCSRGGRRSAWDRLGFSKHPGVIVRSMSARVEPALSAKARRNAKAFLTKASTRQVAPYKKKQVIFTQGDPADAVFYVEKGTVKLTVLSEQGKPAIVAMLGSGDFFGEGCLAGQRLRMATASAMTEVSVVRVDQGAMVELLHGRSPFSERFMAHLLARNVRIEEDLVDQLFNSTEKRLARVLLLLAQFGKEGKTEPLIPKISQEILAEMVGTTRPRISTFMNKFRKLGFIAYNGGLHIHTSLLNVLLHDS